MAEPQPFSAAEELTQTFLRMRIELRQVTAADLEEIESAAKKMEHLAVVSIQLDLLRKLFALAPEVLRLRREVGSLQERIRGGGQ